MERIKDEDLMLINREVDGVQRSFKETGADIKASITVATPPEISTAVLIEDSSSSSGSRFTNKNYTATATMTVKGIPYPLLSIQVLLQADLMDNGVSTQNTTAYGVLDDNCTVLGLQSTPTDFHAIGSNSCTVSFPAVFQDASPSDNRLPLGTSIAVIFKAKNTLGTVTLQTASLIPGRGPLLANDPADVTIFNSIKTQLESYRSDLVSFRANLVITLLSKGFTPVQIAALGL